MTSTNVGRSKVLVTSTVSCACLSDYGASVYTYSCRCLSGLRRVLLALDSEWNS